MYAYIPRTHPTDWKVERSTTAPTTQKNTLKIVTLHRYCVPSRFSEANNFFSHRTLSFTGPDSFIYSIIAKELQKNPTRLESIQLVSASCFWGRFLTFDLPLITGSTKRMHWITPTLIPTPTPTYPHLRDTIGKCKTCQGKFPSFCDWAVCVYVYFRVRANVIF